jgi:hypothetical protein
MTISTMLIYKIFRMTQLAISIHNRLYNIFETRDQILNKLCSGNITKESLEKITWKDYFNELSAEDITEITLCVFEIVALFASPFEEFISAYLFAAGPQTWTAEERRIILMNARQQSVEVCLKIIQSDYLAPIIAPLLGIAPALVHAALVCDYKYNGDSFMPYVITVIIKTYKTDSESSDSSEVD